MPEGGGGYMNPWNADQVVGGALGLGDAVAGDLGGCVSAGGVGSINGGGTVGFTMMDFMAGMTTQFAGAIGPVCGVWNAEQYAMTTELG